MSDLPVKPSPFHAYQASKGALFGEIGGWQVPLSFENADAGWKAARSTAAIADLTPCGRIKVTGKDRLSLLQRISTNDLKTLTAGSFVPTLFVTPKGRIVDRAIVFDRGESLLLWTSPAGRTRLRSWIQRYVLSDDVQMTDVTNETGAFALVGPESGDLVKPISGVGAAAVGKGRFLGIEVADVQTLIAPLDMLPGAWLFLAEVPGVLSVFEHVRALEKTRGLAPVGTEDLEVLRVEAGIPWDGHELTEEWNPWEAGLEGSVSATKGCYTGQEVIARLKTYDKIQRSLVGLRMASAVAPAVPARIVAVSSGEDAPREIGTLTSAVRSQRLGETIGLGLVRQSFVDPGTEVAVGEDRARAVVAALPFP